MGKLDGKFVNDNSLNDLQLRLRNNQPLRARNNAGNADVNVLRVGATDEVEFLQKPTSPTAPTNANDLTNKSYVDSQIPDISGKASTTLNNLGTTSINADMLPSADNTRDLGSAALRWQDLFAATLKDASSVVLLDVVNRLLKNAAGTNVIDFSGTDIDVLSRKIVNLVDPTSAQDAATKAYVDANIGGGGEGLLKTPVMVIASDGLDATYATGVLTANNNGGLTVDTYNVVVGDLILVAAQVDQMENGLYEVTDTGDVSNPFILTRHSTQAEGMTAKLGSLFYARQGTKGGFAYWQTLEDALIGTDDIGYAWAGLSRDLANVGPISGGLSPSADSAYSLGGIGLRWADIFLSYVKDSIGGVALDVENRQIVDNTGVQAMIFTDVQRELISAGATALLDFTGTNLDFKALVAKNVADPVDPQDIASKAYVDAQVGGGGNAWGKERITLDATDITNGYVDLAEEVVSGSLQVVVSGLVHDEGSGLDYTVTLEAGVSRVTFETGLAALLVDGSVMSFQYQYAP